jgi:hypothetical protein
VQSFLVQAIDFAQGNNNLTEKKKLLKSLELAGGKKASNLTSKNCALQSSS